MEITVKLYSTRKNEINRFLKLFFTQTGCPDEVEDQHTRDIKQFDSSLLEWQKKYQNPLETVDIIGTFIENIDKFKINMWISLDPNIFINVTNNNADSLIRYIYERYPW